jgi:hypothetical protein
MGTKNKPGRFDCHDRAEPDEPRFTLLARDPLAGFLTSIWSSMRYGDVEAARAKFERMLEHHLMGYVFEPDDAKASEALDCAMEMFAWREHRA